MSPLGPYYDKHLLLPLLPLLPHTPRAVPLIHRVLATTTTLLQFESGRQRILDPHGGGHNDAAERPNGRDQR